MCHLDWGVNSVIIGMFIAFCAYGGKWKVDFIQGVATHRSKCQKNRRIDQGVALTSKSVKVAY